MKHLLKAIETLTLAVIVAGFFLLFTTDFRIQITGGLLIIIGSITAALVLPEPEKEPEEC